MKLLAAIALILACVGGWYAYTLSDAKRGETAEGSRDETAANRMAELRECYQNGGNPTLLNYGGKAVKANELGAAYSSTLNREIRRSWFAQIATLEQYLLDDVFSADHPDAAGATLLEKIQSTIEVDPRDVRAFYDNNKNSYPKGISFAQVESGIQQLLQRQQANSVLARLRGGLNAVSWLVSTPCPPPIVVERGAVLPDTGPDATAQSLILAMDLSNAVDTNSAWQDLYNWSAAQKQFHVIPVLFDSRNQANNHLLQRATLCIAQQGKAGLGEFVGEIQTVYAANRGITQRDMEAAIRERVVTAKMLNRDKYDACLSRQDTQDLAKQRMQVIANYTVDDAQAVYVNDRWFPAATISSALAQLKEMAKVN